MHVLVGATLLAIAFNRSIRGHYSPDAHLGLEVTGLYWHFVDVVWISSTPSSTSSDRPRAGDDALKHPARRADLGLGWSNRTH